ncbi:MAG TPA: 2'-5' RNA ligase family protein [Ktedonobacteraceae bacterium]|nr:2'-5' RNA ligase family protein [Ktedonobacteraceae bacterium]
MVRLKIHLSLDEQAVEFCLRKNAQIRRITDSAIVFSETSPMLPHITLVMGELVPSQSFQALTRVTTLLARSVKPLTLRLSQPYIDSRRYVLCDVQENPALIELRKRLSETLKDTYLTTRETRPYVPHLTLAHINAQQEQVNAFLNLVNVTPQMVCSQIEISHVGPKGACVDRLFACNLAHGDDRKLDLRTHQLSIAGMPC